MKLNVTLYQCSALGNWQAYVIVIPSNFYDVLILCAASIVGDILGSLYAVVTSSVDAHESCRNAFMTRLNKWLGKLNDDLRCDLSQDKPVPKPCVLILHLWYWSAVVLVNRDLCVFFFPFLSARCNGLLIIVLQCVTVAPGYRVSTLMTKMIDTHLIIFPKLLQIRSRPSADGQQWYQAAALRNAEDIPHWFVQVCKYFHETLLIHLAF